MPKRINFKKITDFFGKLPEFLDKRAFLFFLVFLLISLILGSFLFYKYSILIDKEKPDVVIGAIKFNKQLYQEILEIRQIKEQQFEKTNLKEYPSLFKID